MDAPAALKRQLTCTVPITEYLTYEREAAKRGITISDLVRHRLRQQPLPDPAEEDDE